MSNPFRYFNRSPGVIRLAVMPWAMFRKPLAKALKRWDRPAALRFLNRAMKRYGRPKVSVTDRHLNRRDVFKESRSAAPAEWRQLAA